MLFSEKGEILALKTDPKRENVKLNYKNLKLKLKKMLEMQRFVLVIYTLQTSTFTLIVSIAIKSGKELFAKFV